MIIGASIGDASKGFLNRGAEQNGVAKIVSPPSSGRSAFETPKPAYTMSIAFWPFFAQNACPQCVSQIPVWLPTLPVCAADFDDWTELLICLNQRFRHFLLKTLCRYKSYAVAVVGSQRFAFFNHPYSEVYFFLLAKPKEHEKEIPVFAICRSHRFFGFCNGLLPTGNEALRLVARIAPTAFTDADNVSYPGSLRDCCEYRLFAFRGTSPDLQGRTA
ncbi:MAG: hypothetical protein MUD08_05220 [Cytophagales bacterium]|jgi:hypothetical protein|nr:hypothetical protein [Cytophagales bacterium]